MMRKNDKTKSQQSISVQLFIPQANPPYGILEAQLRKVQGRAHHAGKEMTDREFFFSLDTLARNFDDNRK